MEDLLAGVTEALGEVGLEGTITRSWPVPGGHSGVTVGIETAGDRRFVVKASPAGEKPVGRNDVLRQARILRALEQTPVRCPRVWASRDGGSPLFVMDFLAGDATEPVLDEGGAPLHAATVDRRARAAVRELVALHSVDLAAVGLADDPVMSVGDELERWSRTMAAIDPTLSAGGSELFAALINATPTTDVPRLVHGDFRLGNVMCTGDEVTGVVDWEIWSITDARVDLGWLLLFCDDAHFPGVSVPAAGMPSSEELLAEYSLHRGEPVRDVEWFLAFACYKMAAIMGHNLRRHREGRHHDPYQERLPPTINALLRRGRELVSSS